MSIAEQIVQKLPTLTEDERKKILQEIAIIEQMRGFDLRKWALEQFSEEEFLAGLEEIRKNGGHSLDEILPELERLVAER